MKGVEALNDVLFEQIDRINKCELNDEKLAQEIARGDSIIRVAKTLIDNGRLILDAAIASDKAMGVLDIPILIGEKQTKEKRNAEQKLLVRKNDE